METHRGYRSKLFKNLKQQRVDTIKVLRWIKRQKHITTLRLESNYAAQKMTRVAKTALLPTIKV